MSQLFQSITIDLNEKETETVQTMDSWEESFSDASVCGSVETLDLLELDDDDDDAPEFYYDDDADYLDYDPILKNSCIQRAMDSFTGLFNALTLSSTPFSSPSRPVDIVLTDGMEDDFLFR